MMWYAKRAPEPVPQAAPLLLCKDCKWCVERGTKPVFMRSGGYRSVEEMMAFCAHPAVCSPVSGEAIEPCDLMREYDTKCGRRGRWWEPKP